MIKSKQQQYIYFLETHVWNSTTSDGCRVRWYKCIDLKYDLVIDEDNIKTKRSGWELRTWQLAGWLIRRFIRDPYGK